MPLQTRDKSSFGLFQCGDEIASYTRAEALADGWLIDVSDPAKEAGLLYSVAVTADVWVECIRIPEGLECDTEANRVWNIVWLLTCEIILEKREVDEITFRMYVRQAPNRLPQRVTLRAVCEPDDNGNPCLTVMLAEEAPIDWERFKQEVEMEYRLEAKSNRSQNETLVK
jgi:uncharacterized protein DUF6573